MKRLLQEKNNKPKYLAEYIADDLPRSTSHVNKGRLLIDRLPLGWTEWRILAYLDETPFWRAKDLFHRLEPERDSRLPVTSTFLHYLESLADKTLVKWTGFPADGLLLTENGRKFMDLYKDVRDAVNIAEAEMQSMIKAVEDKLNPMIEQRIKDQISQMTNLLTTKP